MATNMVFRNIDVQIAESNPEKLKILYELLQMRTKQILSRIAKANEKPLIVDCVELRNGYYLDLACVHCKFGPVENTSEPCSKCETTIVSHKDGTATLSWSQFKRGN